MRHHEHHEDRMAGPSRRPGPDAVADAAPHGGLPAGHATRQPGDVPVLGQQRLLRLPGEPVGRRHVPG
ncbi:hypothetical protein ACFFX0_11235 [Citricoccus parietis]|uniref:Uncharacterized protein n=1 Tax=Citricoccus parietis TaxID=592307 RepID=A0ABV5FYI6_9MICC